jgi:hypothetical protein
MDAVPQAKICRKCELVKRLDEFYRAEHNKDKLKNICKTCNKAEVSRDQKEARRNQAGLRVQLSGKTLARFEAKYCPEPNTGCWLWFGAYVKTWYGEVYGSFCSNRVSRLAHRVSYEHHVGPIPDGLDLDHLCRMPRCVNPAHLEPVTRRENILRGKGCSVGNAEKTHCPKGHPYEEGNIYIHKRGKALNRECRECVLERERAKRRRPKVAHGNSTDSHDVAVQGQDRTGADGI